MAFHNDMGWKGNFSLGRDLHLAHALENVRSTSVLSKIHKMIFRFLGARARSTIAKKILVTHRWEKIW